MGLYRIYEEILATLTPKHNGHLSCNPFWLVAFLRSAYSKSATGKDRDFQFFKVVKYALQKEKGNADKKTNLY